MPGVLIIGLDGATWTLLEPWARAGRLPHLARLMARGTWGPLRSTVPALTLPAWSSFMTGRNPGAHGVFAFSRMAPHGYEPGGIANASDVRCATMWDVLGRAGRRVGVVNLPPSYPLRPVQGFVVGCMLTPPGEPFTQPPELADELPGYEIDLKAPRGLRRDPARYVERAIDYLDGLCRLTRGRTAATLRLMERHPTDVLCVVFYAPDRVQHNFWGCLADPNGAGEDQRVQAAVDAVYREIDESVGRLVAAAGDAATTIVVSDHGFVPKPERAVHVNRWLADQGFVRRRRAWTARRRVVRTLVPARWRPRYDTLDFIQVHRPTTSAWAETLDYGTTGIWVHVAGRYPLGCVAPGAQYEAVRTRIVDGLRALTDERGELVFRSVQRREELYRGTYVEEAPDVVAVCAPRFGVLGHSLRRDLRAADLFGTFDEADFTGTHDPDGIYVFAGPPVRTLGRHGSYPIEAIAPTVLHLLDVPVPRSMEAPVCTDLLREEFLAAHPVRVVDDAPEADEATAASGWRSEEDEAKVAAHLRSLGYLE
jgi:predicted AlkP superfamily phosphohydrolase/phosphomutase